MNDRSPIESNAPARRYEKDARQETTQPASTGTFRLNVESLKGMADCSFLDGGVETTLIELTGQAAITCQGVNPRGPFDRQPLRTYLDSVPARERHAVCGYLNNRDIQQQTTPTSQRVIIDTYGALDAVGLNSAGANAQAEWLRTNLPFLYHDLEKTARPVREGLPMSVTNAPLRERWWKFAAVGDRLRAAVSNLSSAIAIGQVGKVIKPIPILLNDDANGIRVLPTHTVHLIPTRSVSVTALMSSLMFETQVRRSCSNLNSSLRFTPSEVFPYFPFPWKGQPTGNEYISPVLNPPADVEARLGPFAEALLKLREGLLTQPTRHGLGANEFRGPTALYNAFDNPEDKRGAVEKLRETHRQLEAAVLAEYGWSDLASPKRWTFERPWIDGTWRYVPNLDTRREYLRRLEKLNHQQAAAQYASTIKASRASETDVSITRPK